MNNPPRRYGILMMILFVLLLVAPIYDAHAMAANSYTNPKDALFQDLPAISAAEASLEDGIWWLQSLKSGEEMIPVLAGSYITAQFDGEYILGYAGCNWYWAEYTIDSDASTISINVLGATVRLCFDPPGVVEQEIAYHNLLRTMAGYEQSGNELRLFNSQDEPTLIFLQLMPTAYLPIVGNQ